MTVVVKLGGHALDQIDADAPRLRELAEDLAAICAEGVVVVHGGGPQIEALARRLGVASRFVEGLRVTDDATLEVVALALSQVNLALTAALTHAGLRAVGVAGAAAGVRGQPEGETWGRAALRVEVEAGVLGDLVTAGWVPIVSSLGLDSAGGLVNVNADTVAGAVAGSLGARALLLLSDIDQVRTDPHDPNSAVAQTSGAQIAELLASGAIRDGMRPKARAALDALGAGASRVIVGSGRGEHAVREILAGRAPATEVRE